MIKYCCDRCEKVVKKDEAISTKIYRWCIERQSFAYYVRTILWCPSCWERAKGDSR